ncbi:MAG: hypothetical protein O3A63_11980 [Proteobacteria bacterium]|nr:hypothetical protein [Pseudomonadota bacterium]
MRFDDDERINMVDPLFTRGELRKFEAHSICSAFDEVAEVLGPVNDGKEATVYLCRTHNNGHLAAKVYRARKFRAFSNTKYYIETSRIRDRRAAKAIRQGTRTGKTMTHEMWLRREWEALNGSLVA